MSAASPGDDAIAGLERRLRGLPEAAMRREVVLEALEAADPAEAYELVAAAVHRGEDEAPLLPTLRACIEEVLHEGGATRPLDYALRAAVYSVAAARGDERVKRLLRSPDAVESMAEPGAALPRDVAEIPLGMRRSLARGIDHNLLERLLLDPDPVVITHLLDNPRVTEEDVVRIAARRPAPASTLAEIYQSRRFGRRLRVRQALARNPYCPTDVAVRALLGLPAAELRSIARDATLHELVRAQARDELERRSPDPSA